jgi:hypothetical protein
VESQTFARPFECEELGLDWKHNMAEQRIAAAQRAGELDGLAGKGKPLPPDKFANLSPGMRAAATVLGNAGYAPEEVDLLRELNVARAALGEPGTEAERAEKLRVFLDAELRYNLAMDRHRRVFREFSG